jgi:tripeptide aminopeptidase
MGSSIDVSIVERVLDLALAIQQIPAPSFGESQRATYIKNLFQSEGLTDVVNDAVGNVLARIPGKATRPPLIISAHLDTVFPQDTPLHFNRFEDRIFAPGIGDNSTGLACLFGLLWCLNIERENGFFPGDIWLIANVGEEGLGNLRGMKSVVERFGDTPLAYLVLEGMGLGQIYHRALSVQRYRVSIDTPGGHSWVDYGKPSAIVELAKFISLLSNIQLPLKPRTTMNVGTIAGGTSINTIASSATMELDLRSESPRILDALIKKIEVLVRKSETPDINISMDGIGHRPGGKIPSSHPLVRLARSCHINQGIQPELVIGSTDANIPLSLKLPAICLGLTHGAGAHTTNEFIQTQPLKLGLGILVDLVNRVFVEL